jgi:glyoxalase/bleomycin resistance protein/dioxygenase superfamily protein
MKVNGSEAMLVLHKHEKVIPGASPALVFVVDNIRATYDERKAKGVEFTQLPKKRDLGEHALLKDSEGNLVRIGQGSTVLSNRPEQRGWPRRVSKRFWKNDSSNGPPLDALPFGGRQL